MSSEQQSCLRFSVEESVWFQKGQEVSELMSISLDPDIQIFDQDQYVSIRGALYLTGEYQVEQQEDPTYEPVNLARLVENVEEREDGCFELNHRFPVDITIPKNRIQNLEDIFVSIESFDYHLPMRGCLQLDAELSISGIYGHQQSVPQVAEQQEQEEERELEPLYLNGQEEEEDEPYNPFKFYSESDDSFGVEQNEETVRDAYYQNLSQESVNQEEADEVDYSEVLRQETEAVSPEYQNEDEQEELEHEEDFDTFEVEVRKDANISETQEDDYANNPFSAPNYAFQSKQEEVEEKEENVISFLARREEKQETPKAVVKQQQQPQEQCEAERDENDLSLTKFFASEDNGEDFTRLKICIVQDGDTMDTIAKRYDITIQQLIRVNRLSTEDDIHSGQLLYVPATAYSNS
ncbi:MULTISPECIES: stage VI sporulation protein D [Bacillus]|uniref:stage VI sporulation protein D n=1 Tax=Bacillus TaxID=1386 RepID=UPI00114190F9|nr:MULTISPECIES: stage VI sporulation protein D [Bacillus]